MLFTQIPMLLRYVNDKRTITTNYTASMHVYVKYVDWKRKQLFVKSVISK